MTPDLLHLSIDGKAACDARSLDPDLSSDSPECREQAVCSSCWALFEHLRTVTPPARLDPCPAPTTNSAT